MMKRTILDKAEALHFLQYHLHSDLKFENINEDDPIVLWQSLKDRFNQQKSIVFSKTHCDWIALDFKKKCTCVVAYRSALRRIVSRLCLCDQKITNANMIEKTLSTLHPGNIVPYQ